MELSKPQEIALEMALEFYIRLGLGQIGEIAQRLNLLHGTRLGEEKMKEVYDLCARIEEIVEPMPMTGENVSVYTLYAFLLESQMAQDKDPSDSRKKNISWVKRQIKAVQAKNKEKI